MSVRSIITSKPWIISCVILALLIIPSARAHELWGDEAETALFARNILKYGVPKGWDGTNIMGIDNAVVLDKNLINHTSPWAQYYMVAASFAIFGESSFTARLPSILLFILSIPLLYYVALALTKKRSMAFIATILTALSVQGILFGFQARYYELTNFSGLLFLWATIRLCDKRWLPKAAFVLSGVLFFYAHYVSWASFYVTAGIVGLFVLWQGKKMRSHGATFAVWFFGLSLVIAALCAPWFILLHPLDSRGTLNFISPDLFMRYFLAYQQIGWYPLLVNGVLPVGFLILTSLCLGYRIYRKQSIATFIILILIPFIYMSMMTIITTISNVDLAFINSRYTTVILPLCAMLAAYVLVDCWRFTKWLAVVIFVLYIFTNTLMFRVSDSYFVSFIQEIVHPYQTPEVLVARYLKEHAQKGDTAFVNLDRDHEPLIFLLGDHIRFVNRVSLVNTRIFPKNRGIIPRYIYDFRDEPDWVILYSKRGNDGTFYTMDDRGFPANVDLANHYEEHVVPVFFSDLSRPEIDRRSFSGIIPVSKEDYVYIYKRKK
jgi:Dolichyl-phosphate-mannose-protein mannosyltransferase